MTNKYERQGQQQRVKSDEMGKSCLKRQTKNSFRDATNGDAARELLNRLDVTNCATTIEDFYSKQGEMKQRAIEIFLDLAARSKLCI